MKAQELILKCAADLNELGVWDVANAPPAEYNEAWEAFKDEFDMEELLDISMVQQANRAVSLAFKSRNDSTETRELFVEAVEQQLTICRVQTKILFFKQLQEALDRYTGDDEQNDWIDQDNKERLRGFNS